MCRVRTQNGAVLGTRASKEARPKFPKQTHSRSLQSWKDW